MMDASDQVIIPDESAELINKTYATNTINESPQIGCIKS
jgi:hypothetical protein